jgi:mRNA-degrading endonuclease RelE of RelBE toxin-antitoxin system
MKAVWDLVLHEHAWNAAESLTSREKVQLKKGLRALAADALQDPDAERRSPVGHTYRVKYIGRFRIVYWPDAFTEEIRILEIETVQIR